MRFFKVILLWLLPLVLPLWLGQVLLDAQHFKATEVVVSVYAGYFLCLVVALGLRLVTKVTPARTFVWSLGIHAVVSVFIYPMPATFVWGSAVGILTCYVLTRLSARFLVSQGVVGV